MRDAGKETRLYLSDGKSMTVWNFPCRAAGPSPTSMYLLSATIGELIWACVRACASSSVSSLVEGEDTSSDLGRDKELCPGRDAKFCHESDGFSSDKAQLQSSPGSTSRCNSKCHV